MNIEPDAALTYLRELLEPLDDKIAAREKELSDDKELRKRYRAAIKALEAGQIAAVESSSPKRQCCKKHEAIEIMDKILNENGPLGVDTLKGLAMSKIAETMSKSGAALRLKEALADDRFHVNAEGVVSRRQALSGLSIAQPQEGTLPSTL